ncbi:DUF5988 family protein [Streptomyces sp. NBC_01506]|uniref:DUF5988 family protein n=1 Tax=Streptomyces sp. NBC_01506 TaxID=2903887 RepID=UPI00386D1DE3
MHTTRVVLSGGPEDLPETFRLREVTDLNEKVKVRWRAGYEHFLPTGEVREIGGNMLPVFQWCTSTRIAE